MSERVYMVWDIYDGVRSGIADHNGKPYFFKCRFDDTISDFTDRYELKPLDLELLALAEEQWAIYRAWEKKYHSGIEVLKSHPSNGNISARYDELQNILDQAISNIEVAKVLAAKFKVKGEQLDLPKGCLLEMTVEWE